MRYQFTVHPMSHDKKDMAKIELIFRQTNFWVGAMETSHLLYTGPHSFHHNSLIQKIHIFLQPKHRYLLIPTVEVSPKIWLFLRMAAHISERPHPNFF